MLLVLDFPKVFSYKTWDNLLGQKYKAMQPKSEQSIFEGYYEEVKSYRKSLPIDSKVIFKGDVDFHDTPCHACLHFHHFFPFK